jgi:hypothetical protein
VSFAACVLAVALAATALAPASPWLGRTLFALSAAFVALARLTGSPLCTAAASGAFLLALVHFAVFDLDSGSDALGVELAILMHATFVAAAAVVCRRQARAFGDPFRRSALASSVLAVPLLIAPAAGLAFAYAPLALWLGAVWLAFAVRWRTAGAFAAFQGAVTLAALLAAFGRIERQPWWAPGSVHLRDARALEAFGTALGALALVWAAARRAARGIHRARELWCDDPLSLDRCVLATAVLGFAALAAFAVGPRVGAELKPIADSPAAVPAALVHAFGSSCEIALAVLAAAVLLSWRLSGLKRDVNPHAVGMAVLGLTAPVVWAGTFAAQVAAASALRWGLAAAFALGSAAVAFRAPTARATRAAGFPLEPEAWLLPTLLALLATAAAVVVALSAEVAAMGLNRVVPSGPDRPAIFALMGPIASNLVPLALVVAGLALTAGRERSSGYALAGGLLFVATLTAGDALAVITAGKPLDGTEQTRLCLLAASGAAVWALLWLAAERRVPGGLPLAAQVGLGQVALGLIAILPAVEAIAEAGEPPAPAFDPLGRFGWVPLVAASAAGFWHARRVLPSAVPVVFGFAALVAGVLAAVAVRGWDAPGRWLSFHVMALVWCGAGLALFAFLPRGAATHRVLSVFAVAAAACAARGGWSDPWRPWLPAGLAIASAGVLGGVAVRTRVVAFVVGSGFAVNLAAVCLWLAWGPDTVTGFVLANVVGVAASAVCWTLVRLRDARPDHGHWLGGLDGVPALALVPLVVGLMPALAAVPTDPWPLSRGAAVALALAAVVGLWDRAAALARPVLYATGVLATLMGAVEVDPLPAWDAPLVPPALGAFVLGVAWFAVEVIRRADPLLGMPENGTWRHWLPPAQTVVGGTAAVLGVRIGLSAPSVWERFASPGAVVLLVPAFALLARVAPRASRGGLRTLAVVTAVLAPAALAWAVPEPSYRFAWLDRNGWLFVALAVAAMVGGETAPRTGRHWRGAVRSVAGWAAAGAVVVLCANLLQQVPAFDPTLRRTPLARGAAVAMLAATAGLAALALRFALKPDRDPFALRPARRTGYVYLAELLVVLFFAQVRFNAPELFLGDLAKLWTFAVMALAYVGIGLAELFERQKIAVLALPLRRTGVLLPLIPLVAFWAKPPEAVGAFARDAAPGLAPFLGYLEKLPQQFDTYAWLWFLAGGVYGLVALARNSFGWALLAALATNAALWSLLAHHQVPFVVHPQAWVIPLALVVLASEHINRYRLSAEASDAMRYAGIAMIYVASSADVFLAGVGNSTWLPVILAVLCVAGVLGGMALRVRAFIYLGVGFLLLDLFSMIWYAAVDLQQTWVWYASGIVLGVVVLALFAYLEKRRTTDRI